MVRSNGRCFCATDETIAETACSSLLSNAPRNWRASWYSPVHRILVSSKTGLSLEVNKSSFDKAAGSGFIARKEVIVWMVVAVGSFFVRRGAFSRSFAMVLLLALFIKAPCTRAAMRKKENEASSWQLA